MADILLAVVDILAEIFRGLVSQRHLFLFGGLVWWFFHSLHKRLEEEERLRQNKGQDSIIITEESMKSETSDRHGNAVDLKSQMSAYNLDHKLDSSPSQSSGLYIMPLSSDVATDSEPCHPETISSSTFMKIRANFENHSSQNSASSLPCLSPTGRTRFNQSASLSHHHRRGHSSSIADNPPSPRYDNNYDRTDVKPYKSLLRPLSPRSLGNSPAVSPREERRSRNSKRLSVCGKCRTAGKSTSWSEADSQLRGTVKRTPDRDPSPSTTVFYCGRYISVSNGKQVQIGDHCKINITAACTEEYDDSSTADGDSILDHHDLDHHDLDSNVVTDSEQDDPFVGNFDETINSDAGCTSEEDNEDCEPFVCSFCRAKMTDDEKCELLTVGGAPLPVRSNTYPLGISTADDDLVMGGAELIGQSRSASVSADGCTPPITDEEKEKLFREAKLRIYAAARRHRELSSSTPNFDPDDSDRKSFRIFGRRKQSKDAKMKAS